MSDKEIILFSILWFIAIMLIIAIFLLVKKNNNYDNSSIKLLQNELFHLTKTFDEKLFSINKIIVESLDKNLQTNIKFSNNSNKIIQEITEKISSLEQTNNQIKDITKQLQWLENILKNTKNRWILWEYFLENILKNILPPNSYKLQHKFDSWEIVDAVIFAWDKKIIIDSKFSLENYNKFVDAKNEIDKKYYSDLFIKDLKQRIEETSKYIKPEENTLDFALMFIPSEWIYYDLLSNKIWQSQNLIEYAFRQKKVIIIWPNSFYAYLQTILQGLNSLKIEKQAQEIKKYIINLERHLKNYEEYFDKLWKNLSITNNHYLKAKEEFQKIEKDIWKIKS